MAARRRYSEEQILKVLGEIEAGASIASVARNHGISDPGGTTRGIGQSRAVTSRA